MDILSNSMIVEQIRKCANLSLKSSIKGYKDFFDIRHMHLHVYISMHTQKYGYKFSICTIHVHAKGI